MFSINDSIKHAIFLNRGNSVTLIGMDSRYCNRDRNERFLAEADFLELSQQLLRNTFHDQKNRVA